MVVTETSNLRVDLRCIAGPWELAMGEARLRARVCAVLCVDVLVLVLKCCACVCVLVLKCCARWIFVSVRVRRWGP